MIQTVHSPWVTGVGKAAVNRNISTGHRALHIGYHMVGVPQKAYYAIINECRILPGILKILRESNISCKR